MSKPIVYGIHSIQALLTTQPQKISKLWLNRERNDHRLQQLLDLAAQHAIPQELVPVAQLNQLANGGTHQGIVANLDSQVNYQENDLKDLLNNLEKAAFLLVLDGVQDPHNLGACLRTANAAGVDAVIAPRDRAASLTPTVRKVACGAAEFTPFIQVTNLARTLRYLQQQNIWIIGTSDQAEASLFELKDLHIPIAFVLGAEEQGMRRLTQEHCDQLVRIPMLGNVPSLNVSVSAGVCLFEVVKQRI